METYKSMLCFNILGCSHSGRFGGRQRRERKVGDEKYKNKLDIECEEPSLSHLFIVLGIKPMSS
jgi:hypothetical protein